MAYGFKPLALRYKLALKFKGQQGRDFIALFHTIPDNTHCYRSAAYPP